MTIHLVRHADAVPDEEDPARPLSAKGRIQVARLCAALQKNPEFNPVEIWHSPLLRARQTAELLSRGLNLSAPLVLTQGLEPDDDPERIAALLRGRTADVAVVGHEPHLGVLAALMLHGPERPGLFYPFAKAGVLALSRDGKRWRCEWLARGR